MNPQLLVVLIFLTSAFSFFSFMILVILYNHVSSILKKAEKMTDLCNNVDNLQSHLTRFEETTKITLRGHHDKLNLIKDRQWVICESMDLKKVVEDWDKNKI